MPIFQRLLLSFLAVGVLIGAPLIIVSFKFSKDAARLRTEQNITQQIAILSASFEQEFGLGLQRSLKQITGSEALAQYLSASQDERIVNAKALETSFLKLQADFESYSGLYYADAEGHLVASAEDRKRSALPDLDTDDRSTARAKARTPTRHHFEQLFKRIRTTPTLLSAGNMEWFMPPREITIEGPFVDERGRLTLLAGLPSLDFDNGAFSGAVVIRVSLDPFVDRLKAVKIFDEQPIWLFTRQGDPLLRPGNPLLELSAKDFTAKGLVNELVFGTRDEGLLAYRDLVIVPGEAFLRIAYAVPEALLFKDFESALNFFLAVLALSALAVLMLAYVVARNFSKPIIELAGAASRLARGELASRVEVQSAGEVLVLVDSFNKMSENLQLANQNRARAFAVLRETAAQMQGQQAPDGREPQGSAVPAAVLGDLSPGQEDAQDLRAVSDLITQLISEREQNLSNLRDAKESAEQANRAKSQFLANTSHEIRTPLNAVLGMLKLLQNTMLTHRQLDYVSKTEGAARSLLLLLNDILDFSKIEADKMTLDPRAFRMDRLLRDLSVILSANVGAKSIEVLFDIEPDLPRALIGDDLRLQQVLINLGGNAIKFTHEGEVVLRVRSVARTATTVDLEFSMRDTGIGIATEHQAQIFSGFSQAEASTTRRFGGTGLGLAICQRLVSLMGGQIKVDSAPGEGSVFSFTVGFELGPDAADPAGEREAASVGVLRALVVDDNANARELLAVMVRSLGWHVDMARDGPEAVDKARQRANEGQPYQAVFMDWQMPELDGWETSQKMREIPGFNEASLVMMVTAHGREMLAQRSPQEQSMLDGFLVKPVTASMLFDAVADARIGLTQPRMSATAARAVSRPLEGLRVLLVEDNPNNQQVAQELLAEEGALVDVAENGKLGVEALERAEPAYDAVLMDLQMPVMDGYTAAALIRQNPRHVGLPIIAMTANAMASDREACLAAGMNDHVGKPFDLQDLVDKLLHHTGRSVPAAQARGGAEAVSSQLITMAESHGIDLGGALNRLGGNAGVYLRLLGKFLRDLSALPDQLQTLLQQGRRLEAAQLMHTYKGLAGTLGAQSLSRVSAHAEVLLNAPEVAGQLEPLTKGVDEVVRATLADAEPIAQALARELAAALAATPQTAVGDRDGLLKALADLAQLLRNSDMRAVDLVDGLRRHHTDALGERLEALDQAVSALDFDQAMVHCLALERWVRE